MSFILDALKKSENERQRQNGPALFEMKVAARRQGLPAWATGLIALLVINLGVVIWLVVRRSPDSATHAAATQVPSQTLPVPPPATLAPAPPAAATSAAPATASSTPADSSATVPEDGAAQDEEPAVEPEAASTPAPVRTKGMPDYQQIAGTPSGSGMPNLRLDLHVFAVKPAERSILLNMHRLHEGESLPEGVRVESITPDGAVLSWRGTRFLLERE